ncbi:MAG: ABC transporter substrate-binding protein [Halobacteriovoraceae bacterium]|nr:ABC transporter substrate-binding protein [Halobacteriovoraceae bacterium]|tara:strand:- start:69756 stop:71372 length:1617 start_codon:yes stop_codon:yes gene_type:complete
MNLRTLLLIWISLSYNLSSYSAENFIYCSEATPAAFNPQVTTDGTSNNAAAHTLYEKLTTFQYGSTTIIPALATSWELSPDQKKYTFQIRKNVLFHTTSYFKPTRPLNADDIIFSFERMLDPNHPYHLIGGGNYEYFSGMDMGNLISKIEKINDYEITIHLNKPEAPFLANLSMSFMSILSKEYAMKLLKEKKPHLIDLQPIGTGPFKFHKYVKDTVIRYKKFEHYWGKAPAIENLIFAITPDASVRYQKLKAKECHLIIEPLPYDLASMQDDPHINLLDKAGLNIGYLAFNTQKPPFNNKLVRRAIAHTLNRDSYIQAIYLGNAIVAKNPMPPSLWSYHHDIKPYSFNLKKAKDLLAQAGYPQGFKAELWTLPVTRPYNPNGKKMGEMMQADLAKIGIQVKLISYDWPTYLKKSRDGEHQMIQLGWTGDNGDPDNFLHTLLGCSAVEAGSNAAKWCHKEFDSLITQAKIISSRKERSALYLKAQEIFHEELPWIPLAHSKIFRAMSPEVTGYKIDPLGGDIFKTVDLLSSEKEGTSP